MRRCAPAQAADRVVGRGPSGAPGRRGGRLAVRRVEHRSGPRRRRAGCRTDLAARRTPAARSCGRGRRRGAAPPGRDVCTRRPRAPRRAPRRRRRRARRRSARRDERHAPVPRRRHGPASTSASQSSPSSSAMRRTTRMASSRRTPSPSSAITVRSQSSARWRSCGRAGRGDAGLVGGIGECRVGGRPVVVVGPQRRGRARRCSMPPARPARVDELRRRPGRRPERGRPLRRRRPPRVNGASPLPLAAVRARLAQQSLRHRPAAPRRRPARGSPHRAAPLAGAGCSTEPQTGHEASSSSRPASSAAMPSR